MDKVKLRKIIIIAVIILIASIGITLVINANSMESYKNEFPYEPYYCGKCITFGDVGNAITYRKCAKCGRRMEFNNTDVDELCSKCSNKTKRCKHCGVEIEVNI